MYASSALKGSDSFAEIASNETNFMWILCNKNFRS